MTQINTNFRIIKEKLNKTTIEVESLQISIRILTNLEILRDIISDLELSIALARIGTISTGIITGKGIRYALKHNPAVSNSQILSAEEYESITILITYSTSNILKFTYKLPILNENPAKLYQLIPFPNEKNQILLPKHPYLLMRDNEFTYPPDRCSIISKDRYQWDDLSWMPMENTEDCIINMIQA